MKTRRKRMDNKMNADGLRKFLRGIAMTVVLGFCAFTSMGCPAFGVIADKVAGNSTVPAKYDPPKEPTLVLVENYRVAAGGDVDCDRIGRVLSQSLNDFKVAPLVDFAKLTQLRDQDPEGYRKMSVQAIGQSVGAKQIIYVSLLDYSSETPQGAGLLKWQASVKVKVIDATTGQSKWPVDLAEGEPISAETVFTRVDPNQTDWTVRDDLNKQLADKISKLFHPWVKEHDDAEDYQQ
jgi:hypothetical protein